MRFLIKKERPNKKSNGESMKKDKDKIIEIDTQIKEKIGFASILNDRIYAINKAFDSTDRNRIQEALHTGFVNLTPYIDSNTKSKLKKKIKALRKISDKEDFTEEAYEMCEEILKVLRKKDMLVKEIPTTLG